MNRIISYGWLPGCARVSVLVPAVCVLLGVSSGCTFSSTSSHGLVQVQFYSPEGASVTLHQARFSPQEVRSRGPMGDRLEHSFNGQLAVFDLDPGSYRFAYTGAAGAEDANIYGMIEIRSPGSGYSSEFCRHAFIPIKMPSESHQEAEHLNPSRDLSYGEGLEGREFAHLKQGDMITKVYFVADLDRVKYEHDVVLHQAINDIDRELLVLSDRETYLDARYNDARRHALFRDPEMNIEDKLAQEKYDVWGIDEDFVKIARKRQALAREREGLLLHRRELEDQRGRRSALLRSMNIIHRAGSLVLATPDLSLPYRDMVQQASDLGDVIAVVRYGGRHQYWLEGASGSMAVADYETSMGAER